jgi:drug/metabolite transporter (DMT)-like permease
MDTRKSLDGQAMGLMTVLCLIWGLQQVVLKVAAPDVSPLMQIAVRSGVAALLLGALMRWRGERPFADGLWRPGLLVGVLFALEFLFIGEGLRFTSASHMAVFLYTAPIFVALGLHWKLPAERMAPLQWVGVAVAFGGIAVTFLGRDAGAAGPLADVLFGDFLAVLAGAAWGATTVTVRLSRLAAIPATQTLLYQLVGGFFLLMIAAGFLGQLGFRPTPTAFGSIAFNALIVSFASYLAWYWLLTKYLASRLGIFSFMTPLFGVAFGVWLLGEPLEPNFVAGAIMVLAGIVLVSGYGWVKAARMK